MTNGMLATVLFAAAFAPAASADGLTPGSVLIYPIQRSSLTNSSFFSIVAITNTNLVPATPINALGGSTNVHWEYVNTIPNPIDPYKPYGCQIVDRVEFLTPGDTRTILTSCHNAAIDREGYLVATAQDPNAFSLNWAHDYLVGSELVVNGNGIIYIVNAIPFESVCAEGTATDVDGDGQLDFDGVEYEPIPDDLYIDVFTGGFTASLVLINMSGGPAFTAHVGFDIFNDNEFPLSATLDFNCWVEEELKNISDVFSASFLVNNTPNDPTELDWDCDGVNDLETGWARIKGLTNTSPVESYLNPALLGAYSKGYPGGLGGRRLWESTAKQDNGDFLKLGTDDPEFP
jgi:hypothetical protein